jgi:predicted phosphodiesterase
MRTAALYDIHGNLPALEAVLKHLRGQAIDRIVVGGDVIPGPMPCETLDLLLQLKTPVDFILGNGEVAVLQKLAGQSFTNVRKDIMPIIEWTASQLRPEHNRVIRQWPKTVQLDGGSLGQILFCHGTPQDENEIFTRLTPEDRLRGIFDGLAAALAVCGHTHMQFDRTVGATRIINAGSVGLPFGRRGAYWLLLDSEPRLQRTDYDFETAAERIRNTSYPQAEQFASNYVLNPPSEEQMLELFSKSEPK